MTYPDSVRRVRPPKTTIPKTETALPSSQYATDLELVSGKELLLAFDSAFVGLIFFTASKEADGWAAAVVLVLELLLRPRTCKGDDNDNGDAFWRALRACDRAERTGEGVVG